MSSALFGPDGTQPFDSDPLPDSLASGTPEISDSTGSSGTTRAAGVSGVSGSTTDDWTASMPPPKPLTLPPLPLPPLPDAAAIRRAMTTGDAGGAVEADPLPTPPTGFPAVASPPTPPAGFPAPPRPVDQTQPMRRPVVPQGYQPPPAPRRAPPPQHRPPQHRPPQQHRPQPPPPPNPLIRAKRTGVGGWIGCLTVLVFVGAVTFDLLISLIGAVIDLFR